MMKIFEELEKRELVAQVTNREKVKEILNENKVYFYIGFDPTADALHVGHLAQIMIASRLQRAGHVPIILFGGGTALIGDPSGKTDMRKMLTADEINHNIERFKVQASKFIDFSPGKALIVNNADWLMELNYVKFLREIGVHFSVNRMLAAECYKQRLERGLTFFEMNYMVMQGYDFLVLNRKY
ncbi:MAG: tyrosine--tRNA ligase, partial [Acutalibacteraceae bacterium]